MLLNTYYIRESVNIDDNRKTHYCNITSTTTVTHNVLRTITTLKQIFVNYIYLGMSVMFSSVVCDVKIIL